MLSTFDATEEQAALPDISEAVPLTEADGPMIQEVIQVLRKHGALSRFGLTLLHQHFPTTADEVLVEATDVHTRTQTIHPCRKVDVAGLPVKETAWRLDSGRAVMSCLCVMKDGHMHLPVQCDGRLKEAVRPVEAGLAQIMSLRPVSFAYSHGAQERYGLPSGSRLGFVAQEVQHVIPEAVTDNFKGGAHMAIDFAAIIPALVRAIQEQQEELIQLKQRLNAST